MRGQQTAPNLNPIDSILPELIDYISQDLVLINIRAILRLVCVEATKQPKACTLKSGFMVDARSISHAPDSIYEPGQPNKGFLL